MRRQRSPLLADQALLLPALLAFSVLSFVGCAAKPPSKAQRRAITGEVVAAAQRIGGRGTEITIRPEREGPLAADGIYVSLRDGSQTDQLKRALGEIANRHRLSFAETSTAGVIRFDFSFHRERTHTIHVIAPLAERASQPAQHAAIRAELAIILDDLGQDQSATDQVLALPFPLTVSVLPHLPLSAEVAEEAYRRGDEVMLHLPMQSLSEGEPAQAATPEPVELRVGLSQGQIAPMLDAMLETVPHAVGVNNHQGSRATSDPSLMQALMPLLRQRGLFFIDSRTTAATVAYNTAERAGVRAASRKVFLDDTPTRQAVLAQLDLAAGDALHSGSAIAIGHPHPATIAALAEAVPGLVRRGVRLVFASDLVH